MERYLDILLERAAMVENWRRYVIKIYDAAKSILPDACVYVFGSVVMGEATGGSDVDILVVSKSMPRNGLERMRVRIEIEKAANLPLHHPFEFHLVNEEEAKWYFERVSELQDVSSIVKSSNQ